jgi:RNA polymerase sigma-70 factor (ECF subfamily)
VPNPLQAKERPTVDDPWAVDVSARIASGDRLAMGELYEARYAMLFSVVRQRTGRDEEFACDCVHDAWLRIMRHMPRFSNVATLDAWLVRVAMSAALDRTKRDRTRLRREGDRAAIELRETNELLERLRLELELLDDSHREALVVRFLRDIPLGGVAEVLGIGVRAAESRVRRAIARLRGQWTEARDE